MCLLTDLWQRWKNPVPEVQIQAMFCLLPGRNSVPELSGTPPPLPVHVMDTDVGSVPATAEGLDLLHCLRNKRSASGVLSHFRQDSGSHVTRRSVRNRRSEGGTSSRLPLTGPVTCSTAGRFFSLVRGVKASRESLRRRLILSPEYCL